MNPDKALLLASNELGRAFIKFPKFAGPHEGYAVILEELDELWAEIKDDKRSKDDRKQAMRAEAIQVAAMALRFVVDIG